MTTTFQSVNQFVDSVRAGTAAPAGHILLADGTYAQYGAYNNRLAVGIANSQEVPSVNFPLIQGALATPALVAKLRPGNAADAWNSADSSPAVQSKRAAITNFDKAVVHFKNYEVSEYFNQLNVSFEVFKEVWMLAHADNSALNDDLAYVAATAKRIENDWNPQGCEAVIASAQNRFRDEKGDHFRYAEVSAALLSAVAKHFQKPARFIPVVRTVLSTGSGMQTLPTGNAAPAPNQFAVPNAFVPPPQQPPNVFGAPAPAFAQPPPPPPPAVNGMFGFVRPASPNPFASAPPPANAPFAQATGAQFAPVAGAPVASASPGMPMATVLPPMAAPTNAWANAGGANGVWNPSS